MTTAQTSDRSFLALAALLFAGSSALTVSWCASMSAMPGMDMPGGGSMSMAWMRMPGQSWPGAAATFLGMWTVMMIAMMLPVLVPMLVRYRRALTATDRLGRLTAIVTAGYFLTWALTGAAIYPLGVAFSEICMRAPVLAAIVPVAAGVIVALAGALQFTAWKDRQLSCCRNPADCREVPTSAGPAWRHGIKLGIRCVRCCAGLTTILLVVGVMDLTTMVAVTIAIAAERLTSHRLHAHRVVGVIAIASGLWLITVR